MPKENISDQEEAPGGESEEAEVVAEVQGSPKIRKPYSRLAIELNEDDLESKGVRKLLVAEISRLEAENAELSNFRDEFHTKDKECARFVVRLRKNTMVEILYTLAIAVGSALLGLTQSADNSDTNTILTVFAISLFVFALLAKWKGDKDES